MKIAIFPAVALAFGTLGLVSCGEEAQAPVEAATNSPAGVAVADGRLVLPAVKGNPGAIYFTVSNDSDSPVTIRTASLKGAGSTMIHQMSTADDGQASMNEVMQIDVPANGTLEFKPGDLHVMAMELDETLAAGGTADVTLHFARGDKVTFPAEILAAGDER